MPLVTVVHPLEARGGDLVELSFLLRETVSKELDCEENPDARLTPDDIEVFLQPKGFGDRSDYDYFVRIEAMSFPERAANRQARADAIKKKVQNLLVRKKVAVWVVLQPEAAWAG